MEYVGQQLCHTSQNGTVFMQGSPCFDAVMGCKIDIIHVSIPNGLDTLGLLKDVLEIGEVHLDKFLSQMFGYEGGNTEFVCSFV